MAQRVTGKNIITPPFSLSMIPNYTQYDFGGMIHARSTDHKLYTYFIKSWVFHFEAFSCFILEIFPYLRVCIFYIKCYYLQTCSIIPRMRKV